MMEHHHRNHHHHHRRRKDDDDDNGRRPRGATEDEVERKDGATLTTTALKKKKTPPGAAAARRAYTRREVFAISNSTMMMMMPSKTKPSVFLIIVDGVVLNVQDFSHPGGQDALEKYRGKDATRAFRKESAHGRNAAKMLNKYVVGWIVEDAKDALNNNNARRIEEEDVVSNASTSSSSSAASWTYHRRNRSNSESSEEVVPRMVYLEGGENVRRESSSEDLERLSDGDGSETNAAVGLNACASFEDVTGVPLLAARRNDADDELDDYDNENKIDEYGINFNKPLLRQVPFLKEKYFEWTHIPEPSRADGTQQRFFQADWMEALSVTAWYVVLLIWLPVIIASALKGVEESAENSFSRVSQLVAFCFGLFAWGFKEYAMHRFLFHKEPPADSPFFITLHFLFHGCHHKHPMDALRLVFPPVLAIPIAFGFYSFYSLLCGQALAKIVMAGTLTGYVSYDMTHYACHHLASATSSGVAPYSSSKEKEGEGENIFTRYARGVKRRHMMHHYESPDLVFGISQSIWDDVFGTSLAASASAARLRRKKGR